LGRIEKNDLIGHATLSGLFASLTGFVAKLCLQHLDEGSHLAGDLFLGERTRVVVIRFKQKGGQAMLLQ
jgi:uncharacterized membrane protein